VRGNFVAVSRSLPDDRRTSPSVIKEPPLVPNKGPGQTRKLLLHAIFCVFNRRQK